MRRLLLAQLTLQRLKARHWRRYAECLEQQLEGEKQRNQHREDALCTSYLQMMGLFGLPARSGPAQPRPTLSAELAQTQQLPYNTEPFDMLLPYEKSEFFEQYWRDDGQGEAQLAKVGFERAKHEFARMILSQRTNGRVN